MHESPKVSGEGHGCTPQCQGEGHTIKVIVSCAAQQQSFIQYTAVTAMLRQTIETSVISAVSSLNKTNK